MDLIYASKAKLVPYTSRGTFMNSRWRDCPIRGTTKLGLRGNETLEGFSPSPLQKNRFRVEQDLCGRGERIRTSDPCVPNAVRYRAALRPDKINRATSEKGLSYITGSKRKPWASATPSTGNLAAGQVHPFG